MPEVIKTAILGARGYVGMELIQLLDQHPQAELTAVFSRSYEGQKVADKVPGFSDHNLLYQSGDFDALADMDLDVLFLALPDGLAHRHQDLWLQLSEQTVIIDLSADFRFHPDWLYGQPESVGSDLMGVHLIANPGCYATALQMGLRPLLSQLAAGDVPTAFAVSGYSGAGTNPSDKNNPQRLADNLLAYKATGHTHEKEVSHVLNQTVRFMPHVGAHFRGIHLTLSGKLQQSYSADELQQQFESHYAGHPLIQVQTQAPEIQQISQQHHLVIGGFNTSETEVGHFVLNVCLDNLLKGAATQAIQNMNLACANSHHTQPFTGIMK